MLWNSFSHGLGPAPVLALRALWTWLHAEASEALAPAWISDKKKNPITNRCTHQGPIWQEVHRTKKGTHAEKWTCTADKTSIKREGTKETNPNADTKAKAPKAQWISFKGKGILPHQGQRPLYQMAGRRPCCPFVNPCPPTQVNAVPPCTGYSLIRKVSLRQTWRC